MKQAAILWAGLALWAAICPPLDAWPDANKDERHSIASSAAEPAPALNQDKVNIWRERRDLYEKMGTLTGIPWYRLAAIDQYERTLTTAKPKQRKHPARLTGIFIDPPKWAGMLNPDWEDENPVSISMFKGMGRDGSGDGRADMNNDTDLLYSVVALVGSYGLSDDDFGTGLWNYYANPRAVQRVKQFARLYEHFDRLQLFDSAFPLPVTADYSYRSTWGMGRHYGGFRIHEGTDIFAGYGVPVRSTCYGIIEVKGWNRYGGWRIGIRDINNNYHYYAHLSGYHKNIKLGDIVTPGQTIGWVGSSGYGPPGTSGKFPAHLHYGIYRDRGLVEYAYDPYPLLRQWELADLRRLKERRRTSSLPPENSAADPVHSVPRQRR
ncbi:MAG: M23 family metallopeptidase [Paenibacillus dendritiformis]|uniref:M23 family metallopeptidase n=1 Tax=uncultured Paenibacillus sp. TaxID=227322 RepID=UPI0025EC9F83|nr:M23 family metallopeptidase [uncultured Paenibacillus sp.]MDU5141650.1 M23 family metallopeptidase [Paenibacillus dendritiformis]